MPIRRGGRPGIIGLAARTAVVAGTATAVSGRVQDRRGRRAQAEYEQEQYAAAQQQAQVDAAAAQAVAAQAPPQQFAPVTPAAGGTDVLAQLQQLAELKQSGLLSDEEFTAAKAKLLG
jgi:Short C-terminal domain